jgi:hypothetical protein
MAKLAIREISPFPALPERVTEVWERAVSYKKRGKPPRLFKSEPMFGGFDSDYLVAINIGRGSKRLTCTGFVYNGAYPRASEYGDFWVTPDFKCRLTDVDLRAI